MSSALATLAEAGIHADRDGLHVMPPEMLQGAVAMQEECKEFLSKTKQFNDIVGDFIEVMESKSKVIEAEKLRAIGLGNRVDHEKEVRKRKQVWVCRGRGKEHEVAGSCAPASVPDVASRRPPLPCLQDLSRAHRPFPRAPAGVLAARAAGHDQREKGGA
jgi:hypothetical protein